MAAEPEVVASDPADADSRRRARRWWWALGAIAVVAAGWMMYMGRQSDSSIPPAPRAFCRAAERYDDELQRQGEEYRRDIGRNIAFFEDVAATAPRAVRADAELVLDQLRRIEAAPNRAARERLQDDPDVKAALDNVNRHWNQGCGVFERQGGGF